MGAAIGVVLLYALGIIGAIILLVYFIAKRVDAKQREDFEERDN